MFTYVLMSMPFLMSVFVLDFFVLKTRVVCRKKTWLVMAVMLAMTALGDQPIEALFYNHNLDKSLNIHLGYVPIEDFSYTIAAVIGIGALLSHGDNHRIKDAKL